MHGIPSCSVPAQAPAGQDLTAAVLRELGTRPPCRSWGLLKTVLLAVPSLGLAPLLSWTVSFRQCAGEEAGALEALARWSRMRGRVPAAIGPLAAAVEQTRLSPLPLLLSLVVTALIVGVFAIEYARAPFSLNYLLLCTYWRRLHGGSSPLSRPEFLYRVWVAALSLGYLVHWLQVRRHEADVIRFVERFNRVAAAEHLPPVRFPVRGWVYSRPLWVLAAALFALYGAWWAIPMALAGMAQKRYTSLVARHVRHELCKRVKDMIAMPAATVAALALAGPHCRNPRCLAPLRSEARFCTRCGSAAETEGP